MDQDVKASSRQHLCTYNHKVGYIFISFCIGESVDSLCRDETDAPMA